MTSSAFRAASADAGLTYYFQLVALGTTESIIGPQPASVTSNIVALHVTSSSACHIDDATLCLFDRFQVRATFRRYGSSTQESARATSYSATTGFFSTAVEDDVDVVVKMVDFCSLSSAWSVYLGGATDLEVHVNVVDTRTQASRNFVNALGDPWLLRREAAFVCP
jgi:hypothetical protein